MRRSLRCCLPGRGGAGDPGTGRQYMRRGKDLFFRLPDVLQFLVTGGVVAMLGILMMSALRRRGVAQAPAFYTQLAITLQMNLAANSMLTWRARSGQRWQERVATWTRFHVSRSPGILLNLWAFPVAAAHLGHSWAYWGSMGLATALNFLLARFWVFRHLQPS
jgi:putative flippase GtrA